MERSLGPLTPYMKANGGTVLSAASAAAQNKPMIQKLNDEWSTAFNKGDSHALAELYTEDAYVLPAGSEMVHGRQAIQGFWYNAMK